MGTTFYSDDFTDGTVGLKTHLGNGSIAETGGKLVVTCPNSATCDWWGFTTEYAPIAYSGVPRASTSIWEVSITLDSVTIANSSHHLGLTLFQDLDNAYLFGLYADTNVRVEAIFNNSGAGSLASVGSIASPNVQPHVYRIRVTNNASLTFDYSTDGGATFATLLTRQRDFTLNSVGMFNKKWSSSGANVANFDDYLVEIIDNSLNVESVGLRSDTEQALSQDRAVKFEGLGIPDLIEAQISVDKSDRDTLTGLSGTFETAQGEADYLALSASTDSEAHPHFVGYRPHRLFMYNPADEAWDTPTLNSYNGYARDGYQYINGIQQGTQAPWATEAAGNDRSSVSAFPQLAMISVTRSEVVIFDFDGYPTNLDVWMRFRVGPSGTFKLVGRIDESIIDATMVNGVLVIVTKHNGTENGGLFLIDFKREDQQFLNLIRSDNHWKGSSGRDITDRDLSSNFTTSGVSPSLRIGPENCQSVSAWGASDGSTYWVALAGEDPGPEIIEVDDTTGIPQSVLTHTGDIGGFDDERRVHIDEHGWLWHSRNGVVYRNGLDWQGGTLVIPPRAGYVDLGSVTVYDLVQNRRHLYVATDVGVYRIHRGSLETRLIWTVAGGGGVGAINTPGAGEVLAGENPVVRRLHALSITTAGYVTVSCAIDAARSGGVTLIRTTTDTVVSALVHPDLVEDGAYAALAVGI